MVVRNRAAQTKNQNGAGDEEDGRGDGEGGRYAESGPEGADEEARETGSGVKE